MTKRSVSRNEAKEACELYVNGHGFSLLFKSILTAFCGCLQVLMGALVFFNLLPKRTEIAKGIWSTVPIRVWCVVLCTMVMSPAIWLGTLHQLEKHMRMMRTLFTLGADQLDKARVATTAAKEMSAAGHNFTEAMNATLSDVSGMLAKHNFSVTLGNVSDMLGKAHSFNATRDAANADSSVAAMQSGVAQLKLWFDPLIPAAWVGAVIAVIATYIACGWACYAIRRAIWRRQTGEVNDLFAEFDKDNSGQLDKKEAHLFLEKFLLDNDGWDPLQTEYNFEKGSFFLGLFVWNMLFAQGILFLVVFIVSYIIMNQLLRTWLWEHAWELFVTFGLPPLIALIQRKALFSFWLSNAKGAQHPRFLSWADLITTLTSITQGLMYGIMRLVFLVGFAVLSLFRVDSSLLKGNKFFVGFDMPYQSYLSVLSHIRQKQEFDTMALKEAFLYDKLDQYREYRHSDRPPPYSPRAAQLRAEFASPQRTGSGAPYRAEPHSALESGAEMFHERSRVALNERTHTAPLAIGSQRESRSGGGRLLPRTMRR